MTAIPQSGMIYPHPLSPLQERINYFPNSSFATDLNGLQVAGPITWQSGQGAVGTGYAQSSSGGWDYIGVATTPSVFLTVGRWCLSAWMKTTSHVTSSGAGCGVVIEPGTGAYTGVTGGLTANAGTTDWHRVSTVIDVTTAGNMYCWCQAQYGGSGSGTVRWDGAMLEKLDPAGTGPLDYFDGDSPGARWLGTANQSGSARMPGRENRTPYPSFESGTTGWVGDAGTGSITLTPSTAWQAAGASSMRLNGTISASTYYLVQCAAAVQPGRTYTLSMQLNVVDASASGCYANIIWFDAGVNYLSETGPGNIATGTGTKMVSVTATAPAGAVFGFPRLQGIGTNGDTFDIYVDAVLLEDAPVARDFFDGSSPACSWESTAHASSSFQPNDRIALRDDDGEQAIPAPGYAQVMEGDRIGVLLDSSVHIPGINPRPGYFLNPPYADDFNRANDLDPPIGPNWGDEYSGNHPSAIRSGRVEAKNPAQDHGGTPNYPYGYAYWTIPLPPPCFVAFDIAAYATKFDHYVELNAFDPTYNPANSPSYIELGWFRRPEWDPGNPIYANGCSMYSSYRAKTALVAIDRAITPNFLPGDRMMLAYDGVTLTAARRIAGTTTWQLLAQGLPDARFSRHVYYATFWFSNYDAADGGGNAWDNFEFGRF